MAFMQVGMRGNPASPGKCRQSGAEQKLARLDRKLGSVNLGWCEGVTEEGVQSLAHCCSGLEVLDLCGCVKVRPLHALHLEVCQHLGKGSHAKVVQKMGAASMPPKCRAFSCLKY